MHQQICIMLISLAVPLFSAGVAAVSAVAAGRALKPLLTVTTLEQRHQGAGGCGCWACHLQVTRQASDRCHGFVSMKGVNF
mmetsp:Transcript_134197/g.261357  ORF Transcript_134197/g.261357 Transcript_134197/m.261357 type:complete len:81 (+) Transcript_134197:531-773(+)